MINDNQKLELVTEKVTDVQTQDGLTVGTLESGRVQVVPKGTKPGASVRYARPSNQVGGRYGGDQVGGWSRDPMAGQDNMLPLGRSASATGFSFSTQSRTMKLLQALLLEPEADTPGYVSRLDVAGQSLICSQRRSAGFQVPLAAFDASLPGQVGWNKANVITPANVALQVEGGFLNGQADAVAAGWVSDLVPVERARRFTQGASAGQSTAGIGDINWLFELEPVQVAAGAQATLRSTLARAPVTLGQLVLQASEPGAVNAILPRARGVRVLSIEVAGYPLFSGNADGVGAGAYSYDTAQQRAAYIGKTLKETGMEVAVTVQNDTAVTLDVLGAIWCERSQ